MGKPGSPYPCGRAALPRTGGWGNPVSPFPCSSSLCSRETVMRMAHTAAMHMPWERGRPARIAAPRAR